LYFRDKKVVGVFVRFLGRAGCCDALGYAAPVTFQALPAGISLSFHLYAHERIMLSCGGGFRVSLPHSHAPAPYVQESWDMTARVLPATVYGDQ
jgi:hypothetical protein